MNVKEKQEGHNEQEGAERNQRRWSHWKTAENTASDRTKVILCIKEYEEDMQEYMQVPTTDDTFLVTRTPRLISPTMTHS